MNATKQDKEKDCLKGICEKVAELTGAVQEIKELQQRTMIAVRDHRIQSYQKYRYTTLTLCRPKFGFQCKVLSSL